MSGAKETPRQKMIGMMYLVYTALLAMNVSAEILDAFAIVNDGQEKTNASIEMKLDDQYRVFEDQYNKDPDKTLLYWEKAQAIREKTTEMINYIEEEVIIPLAVATEKLDDQEGLFNPKDPKKPYIKNTDDRNKTRKIYEFNLQNFSSKDNYDIPTTIMINGEKASELKGKIQEYRQFVIDNVEATGYNNYDKHVGLLTDYDHNGEPMIYKDKEGQEVTWEVKHFDHIIFVAEMAILNKFVGEIQTTEYDAVGTLMDRVGATDFKFNKLEARVIAKSDYIITGQDYEAEVFLVAADTMRSFDARYSLNSGAATTVKSEGGIIKLKFPGRNIGEQKFSGVIEMVSPETGEIEEYPFGSIFMVAQASATIAPTKMMVMYSGLKNPVSISAPGYKPNEIDVRVTGGTIINSESNKSKGEYIVMPNKAGEDLHVMAYAMKDNKSILLKDEVFRVKQVPKPVATIAGSSSGDLSKRDMLAAEKLEATMEDFDFGGFSYTILSYRYNKGGLPRKIDGCEFDDKVVKDIRDAKSGDNFYFTNIKAKAPDGSLVDLPGSIVITLK